MMKSGKHHHAHRGFTLLELLVVMVIIGLLVSYVGPKYFAQVGKSEVKAAKAQIDALEKALDQYRLDTGRYPSTEQGLVSLTSQPAGEPSYHAAIALYRELEDARGEAVLLTRLAVHAGAQGRPDEARALLERVRVLTQGHELPGLEAQRLSTLSMLAQAEGDNERALSLLRESADVAADCGFTLWETWSRSDLAELALDLGRVDVAVPEARTALAKAWEHGDRRIACACLILLARAALARGEAVLAGRLWGATVAELEETGVLAAGPDLDRLTERLRKADDPDFAEGVERGRTEPLEVAVPVALGQTVP